MGVFFAVGASAGILVGPVSANLLRLDAWFGIAGWQWVFLAANAGARSAMPVCVARRAGRRRMVDGSRARMASGKAAGRTRGGDRPTFADDAAIISTQLLMLTGVQLLTGFGVYGKAFFLPLIFKTFGFSNIAVGYWTSVPALARILGMILFSQSSDRTGEWVWHLMVPLLIGGSALMFAGVSIGISAPMTIAAFALAAFGISGSLPVFWNLPTAFLGASAAARGIAFINSVATSRATPHHSLSVCWTISAALTGCRC